MIQIKAISLTVTETRVMTLNGGESSQRTVVEVFLIIARTGSRASHNRRSARQQRATLSLAKALHLSNLEQAP